MKFSTSQVLTALAVLAVGIYVMRKHKTSQPAQDAQNAQAAMQWWQYAGSWGAA